MVSTYPWIHFSFVTLCIFLRKTQVKYWERSRRTFSKRVLCEIYFYCTLHYFEQMKPWTYWNRSDATFKALKLIHRLQAWWRKACDLLIKNALDLFRTFSEKKIQNKGLSHCYSEHHVNRNYKINCGIYSISLGGRTTLYLEKCLNFSWQSFNKVLKTLFRGFGMIPWGLFCRFIGCTLSQRWLNWDLVTL